MEFHTNLKINDPSDYIGITPWVILVFGGSFTALSLANDGLFLKISILIFLWGVVSSFTRQIFKDEIVFLERSGEKKYGDEHRKLWLAHYTFQGIFFIIFCLLYFIF